MIVDHMFPYKNIRILTPNTNFPYQNIGIFHVVQDAGTENPQGKSAQKYLSYLFKIPKKNKTDKETPH
jgi:hypothetical protein